MSGQGKLFLEVFHGFFGDGLATVQSVHQWRKDRKCLDPFFTKESIKAKIPVMNDAIENSIERMKIHVNDSEFNIDNEMVHLFYNIIDRITFGVETYVDLTSTKYLRTEMEKAINILSLKMFLPLLNFNFINYFLYKYILNSIKSKLITPLEKIIAKQVPSTEEKETAYESGKTTKICDDSICMASYKMGQVANNKNKMIDELFTIRTAGTESTVNMTSFALLMMAMYPEMQEKLYDEIHEVFGDDNRPADYADISNLKYLDLVVKETLRRFTVVPFLLKETEEDTEIGSRKIPAGTGLIISMADIHFNPMFYPEPYKFNPENFNSEATNKRPRYSFIPFSGGSRICIGKNLAEIEMKLICIAFLRKFSFHTTMTMETLKIGLKVVTCSKNGYPVSIKWRNSTNN